MFFFIGYYHLNKEDKDETPKRKPYVSNATRLFAKQSPHSVDQDTTRDKAQTKDLELKVLCIDRSGSMASFGNEVIGGVNSYFKVLNENHSNIKCSIIAFDDIIETPVNNQKLTKKTVLKAEWVAPRGSTALRDGILSSIQCAKSMIIKNNAKNAGVEIVIFTDGMENSSNRISQAALTSMIKKYKAQGWIFTFLAANQDAVASGSKFGFDAGRSMTSSAGHQQFSWKRAASKKNFTLECRTNATCEEDRHFVK